MTTKSIIGRKYVANGTKAIDLNLKQELALGDYKYTIIADPYVCEYTRPTYPVMSILEGFQREVKMIAVNVLDDRTGLTYAVEYHPANLVCEDRTTNQPETPVDFATRAQQIADELKVMFDSAGEGISDKRGVAFFAVSDDGNDKTSTCTGFLGGRGNRVAAAIASACSKNPKVFDIVRRASIEATFHQIFDGGDKKK